MAAVAQRTGKGTAGNKKPNANANAKAQPTPVAERPFSGRTDFFSEPDLASLSMPKPASLKSKKSMSVGNLAMLAQNFKAKPNTTTTSNYVAKSSTGIKDNFGRVHRDNGTLEVRLRDKRKITQALRPDSYSNYEKLHPVKRSFVKEWKESHDKK